MSEEEIIKFYRKYSKLTKEDPISENEMNITTDMCDKLLDYIDQLQQENKQLKQQLEEEKNIRNKAIEYINDSENLYEIHKEPIIPTTTTPIITYRESRKNKKQYLLQILQNKE